MKTIKDYEEDVDVQVKENCPELADTIDLQSIKDIYRQAIKEILEEALAAARAAAWAATAEMKTKIIEYGISLIENNKK
jgi:TRAP-type C4-dicarboxylate transport system substrate-binding protein